MAPAPTWIACVEPLRLARNGKIRFRGLIRSDRVGTTFAVEAAPTVAVVDISGDMGKLWARAMCAEHLKCSGTSGQGRRRRG